MTRCVCAIISVTRFFCVCCYFFLFRSLPPPGPRRHFSSPTSSFYDEGVAIASRRRKDRTYRDTQNLWWEGIMHVAHFGLPFSCHLPIGSFRLRLLMTFHARTTTTTTTRGHQPRIDDIQNNFFLKEENFAIRNEKNSATTRF